MYVNRVPSSSGRRVYGWVPCCPNAQADLCHLNGIFTCRENGFGPSVFLQWLLYTLCPVGQTVSVECVFFTIVTLHIVLGRQNRFSRVRAFFYYNHCVVLAPGSLGPHPNTLILQVLHLAGTSPSYLISNAWRPRLVGWGRGVSNNQRCY